MDPYAVLGVDRKASMDEIKRAYREQAAKYHPDKYAGHELEDLAQEKMKQINQAYDTIVREREGGGGSSSRGRYGGNAGAWGAPGSGSAAYAPVRELINQGRLDEAESMLAGFSHDAEWYFLTGAIAYRRGWFDEAQANWRNAVTMDPSNPEYQQAFQYARREPTYGGRSSYSYGNPERDMCQCCTALMCADCLCDCCH